jgi:hypothetical protein
MTGSEISHARKYGCNPIVVLLNNSRWEMLQAFFPDARYNEDGSLAFLEARRTVGRPRIPRAHAQAVQGRARCGIRRGEALLADRGWSAAGDISPILRGFVHAVKTRVHANKEKEGKRGEGRGERSASALTSTGTHRIRRAIDRLDVAACAALQRPHSGAGGDNYSFLWNLWWMRKVLSSPGLDFFQSTYLFSPFGVDLINHPHTALQGYISGHRAAGTSVIQAENLVHHRLGVPERSVRLRTGFDMVRSRRLALLAGVAFGSSPYVAAHLLGHFDLLTAWVLPLFALCLRRSFGTAVCSGDRLRPLRGGQRLRRVLPRRVSRCLRCGIYVGIVEAVPRASASLAHRKQSLFSVRLVLIGLMAVDAFLIIFIAISGGGVIRLGGVAISARSVQNPLLLLWLLALRVAA